MNPWKIIGWIVLGFLLLVMYACVRVAMRVADQPQAPPSIPGITAPSDGPGSSPEYRAHIVSVSCKGDSYGYSHAVVTVENRGPEIPFAQMFLTYEGVNEAVSIYGTPATIPAGARSEFSFTRGSGKATGCRVDALQDGQGRRVILN